MPFLSPDIPSLYLIHLFIATFCPWHPHSARKDKIMNEIKFISKPTKGHIAYGSPKLECNTLYTEYKYKEWEPGL